MSHQPFVIRQDDARAPLRVGQTVWVLCRNDETADERFHGRKGVVSGFFAEDPSLLAVEVDGLGEDWFFVDELVPEAAKQRTRARRDELHAP